MSPTNAILGYLWRQLLCLSSVFSFNSLTFLCLKHFAPSKFFDHSTSRTQKFSGFKSLLLSLTMFYNKVIQVHYNGDSEKKSINAFYYIIRSDLMFFHTSVNISHLTLITQRNVSTYCYVYNLELTLY